MRIKNVLVLLMLALVMGCSKKEPATSPPQPQQVQPQPSRQRAVPPRPRQGQPPNLPPAPKMLPQIETANQKYGTIAYGTRRPEAIRALGKPQMTNEEGALIWQTSEGKQTISLTLEYKIDGTMIGRKLDILYDRPAAAAAAERREP